VLFIYVTRLASNEIFSPSNKIHREVGRAKDVPAPLVFSQNKPRLFQSMAVICFVMKSRCVCCEVGSENFEIVLNATLHVWRQKDDVPLLARTDLADPLTRRYLHTFPFLVLSDVSTPLHSL
jgi:hypothetical protein